MSVIDSVFSFFVEEAEEHLGNLENGLLVLEKNPSATEDQIDPLFRAAHTLKGSANLVNVNEVGTVAHRLEDLLESVRDGESALTKERVNAMLFALDQMREMIRVRKTSGEIPEEMVSETLSAIADRGEIQSQDRGPEPSPETFEAETTSLQIKQAAESEALDLERRSEGRRVEEAGVVRVGMEKIEILMRLVGEFTVNKNHLLNRLPVMEKLKKEVDFAGTRLLKEVNGFAERYDYTLPAQQHQGVDDAFNELEFDRYDELNLFSRKLREITNDIEEGLSELTSFFKGFSVDIQSLDRMTVEMKEQISAARTIQAGQLFQRFNRTIRDIGQNLGKPVDLYISGGETAIDRVIYDGLFDPLLHIVRNSFAHGIEPESERLSQGKPATAKIIMKAERRGNTVEISVEDDGRGVDLQRVRRRGVEKGFISEQAETTDQELMQLIFRPGFSTTSETDQVSGRGIGMSVVMDRLASLNGTIDVSTEAGKGTTFRLRLPLSLVIVNVIQFSCCDQKMVIPSALVDEIIDLSFLENSMEKAKENESLQRIDLGQLLKLKRQQDVPCFGIVTQSEGSPIILLVDAILGQEDTVIRPFGSFLGELPYFSGTSLAGDGTMRLVVNPARMKHQELAVPTQERLVSPPRPVLPKVLIVDDSLSVRKYAGMVLSAKGYQVITANNGQEALEKLETEDVFSIITDLEMPVMHGYELLRELKRRNILTPTAVLTSRAGEQHRKEAIELGATDYLVKPFDEDGLLAVVRQHKQV